MTHRTKVHPAIDTYASQGLPTTNFGDLAVLHVDHEAGSVQQGFIWLPRPFPRNALVTVGDLHLTLKDGWGGGPHTLLGDRVVDSWKESRLTWDNRPDVAGDPASVLITDGAVNQEVVLDIVDILNDVASGSAWHGIRVRADTDGVKRIRSSEAPLQAWRPWLDVAWDLSPVAAGDLRPTNRQIAADARPWLTWVFMDTYGEARQGSYHVEVSRHATTAVGGAFTDTVWDSGWVASEQQKAHVGVDLTPDTDYFWHVRLKNGGGVEGPWSEIARFQWHAQPALLLSSPGTLVDDTTFPITWTFPGQAAAHILIEEAVRHDDATDVVFPPTERWAEVWRMPWTATGDQHFRAPPKKVTHENRTYRTRVEVLDGRDRVGLPGQPAYVTATQEFQYEPSLAFAPVSNLRVRRRPDPGVHLTWTDEVMPSYYAVWADGRCIEDRLDPTDLLRAGTTDEYDFTCWTLRPLHRHFLAVRRVVVDGGELHHAKENAKVAITPQPLGAWLLRPSRGGRALIAGQGPRTFAIAELMQMLRLPGRRDPVKIRQGVGGYEGSIDGMLIDLFGKTSMEHRDSIEVMFAADLDDEIRLVVGDLNIPVILSNVALPPLPQRGLYGFHADFAQTGDWTFDVRV